MRGSARHPRACARPRRACRKSIGPRRARARCARAPPRCVRPTTNSPPMILIARRTASRSKRLAGLARELAHPAGSVVLDGRIELEHAAGEHEAPRRGVDEQRFGSPGMRGPIAGGELLGDQTVRGRIVRNPQQRLGDAHERDAFLVRQAEFLQERVEERPLVTPRARAFDQADGPRHRPMPRTPGEIERVQQALDGLVLRPQGVLPRLRAQALRRRRRRVLESSSWRPWRASSKKAVDWLVSTRAAGNTSSRSPATPRRLRRALQACAAALRARRLWPRSRDAA